MKLNLGCGDKKLDGYINIDIRPEVEPDVVMDVRYLDDSLFENGLADEIYTSHVLEHLPHWHYHSILERWIGKLKTGGILKIIVPDMQIVARNLLASNTMDEWKKSIRDMYGNQDYPYNYHCNGFRADILQMELEVMGMQLVEMHKDEYNRSFYLKMVKK